MTGGCADHGVADARVARVERARSVQPPQRRDDGLGRPAGSATEAGRAASPGERSPTATASRDVGPVTVNTGGDYTRSPDSVGRPLPTNDIKLVAEDGTDVTGTGRVGELG